MVYDVQQRLLLETDQKLAGLDSNSKNLKPNADGSYRHEGNWVKTTSSKGYLTMLRLHGPPQPWFDKTWKPGDFELVK